VCIGVALGLALAETLVRLFAPQPPPAPLLSGLGPDGLARPSARYGWVWTPGFRGQGLHDTSVVISSLGLRDREYGPARDDEVRIISLGDSFAFGAGVELDETYGKVLERMLRERFPGVTFSVINTGVVGWSQPQMILAFQDWRVRLRPDLAVATFVAANDVQENGLFAERLVQQVKTPLGVLGRHSDAVRLLLKVLFPVTRLLANRSYRGIADTIALFRQLEGELKAAGVPYVMVVIPARHQIRPRGEPGAVLLEAVGLEGFLFRQNRMIIEHFVRDGVAYVDTAPALGARDRIEPVVFDDDTHTNPLGHAIIAKVVFDKLEPMVAGVIERRGAARRARGTSGRPP